MSARPQSIMIVDDFEPDIVYATLMIERSKKWNQVFAARSGREALDLFAAYEESHTDLLPDGFPPLAILLDINMPGMNGFDFLEEFERTYGHLVTTVVCMLSSSGSEADIDRAKAFPCVQSFFSKPFSAEMAAQVAHDLM